MRKIRIKERVLALLLALVLAMSGAVPVAGDTAQAAPEEVYAVDFQLENGAGDFQVRVTGDSVDKTLQAEKEDVKTDYTYVNHGSKYNYTVRKTGYEEFIGEFSLTKGNETIIIPLASKDNARYMEMEPIALNKTSVALTAGSSEKITISNMITDMDYKWESSNNNVATVANDGTITAVGFDRNVNTAVITVTGPDGKTTAKVDVTVAKATPSVSLTATPNSSVDATSIVLEATVPSDATGTVSFEAKDIVIGESSVVNGKASVTYKEAKGFLGAITFQASYSGDNKYINNNATINASYEKTTPLKLVKTGKVIREDASEEDKTFAIEVEESDVTRTLSYDSNNIDVATVDEEGNVTVRAAGEAVITVKANAGANYKEAAATYTVTVQDVVEVNDEVVWEPATKVYDGNTDITLVGTYKEKVKVTYKATTDSKDAGETKAVLGELVSVVEDGKEVSGKYFFEVDGKLKVDKIKITKRTVYLATKDCEVIYGDSAIDQVEAKGSELVKVDTGVVEKESINLKNAYATVAKSVYDLSTEKTIYENEINPVVTDQKLLEDNPNYVFAVVEDETKLGSLIVVAGSANRFEVSYYAAGGNYLWENGSQELWINGGKLMATIEENDFYDQVMFDDGSTVVDLVKTGYDVSASETTSIAGKVYLAKSDANAQSAAVDFVVNVDKKAPTVTFADWKETPSALDNMAGAITFNKFSNSVYSVTVEPTDDIKDELATIFKGAGIKEWSFYSYEASEEEKYDDIKARVARLTDEDWISGGTEAGEAAYAKDAANGEYVVLIKAEDKVGNTAVYASNGIVVEVEKPVIEILKTDGTVIDGEKPYNENLNYKVVVNDKSDDKEAVTSSIEAVTISLVDTDKDKEIYRKKETISKKAGASYTLEELKANAEITLEKEYMLVEAGLNCNLEIRVTAVDKAGNTVEKVQKLEADGTRPEIAVVYSSDADVKNGVYFNQSRTMTITYTEKNFVKEGLTFDLSVDGTDEGILTYEKLVETAANYGIEVGKVESDGNEHTLTIVFNGKAVEGKVGTEAKYEIIPAIVDKAGNENDKINYTGETSEVCNTSFVVDTIAPKITVEYDNEAIEGAIEDKDEIKVYTQENVTATVSIDETNFQLEAPVDGQFDTSAVKFTEKASSMEKRDSSYYEEQFYTAWNTGNNCYKKNFTFDKDANYTFGFGYTDLAGNKAEDYATRYFTVDATVPSNGDIQFRNVSVLDRVLKTITFGLFDSEAYKVTLSGDDYTAGVKAIYYYKSKKALSDEEIKNITDWTLDEESKGFEVTKDEKFVVYGKVVDKAENVLFVASKGAVKETTEPVVLINEVNDPNGKGFYNGAFDLIVTVEDTGAISEDSGITRVWYEISAVVNGEPKSETGELYNEVFHSLGNTTIKEGPGKLKLENLTFTVPSDFNSNEITVTVSAEDVAGVKGKQVKTYKMDTASPVVSVSPELVQGYFNETVSTTINVEERNFDKSTAFLSITNTDGKAAQESGWTIADSGKYDTASNTNTISFVEDGDYVMSFYCVDKADNKSNEYTSPLVTIDKTAPVINVSYDNNNSRNGNYYKAPRTATVVVTEHNFDPNLVQIDTNGSKSGWSTSGDNHTMTVYFGSDNDYTFDIACTDLAGNAAADYQADSFTVDLTNPTVSISGVGDRSANQGTVAPVITISDKNFNPNGVEITLVGANKGKVNVSSMMSSSTSSEGRVISFANFPEGMDDIYTLTAKSVDKAGNETTKTILFSVNRDGSTYKVNEYTKKLIEKGYTNDPQDIVIVETNVDTLTFIELSYTKDGKLVKLVEGKDYKIGMTGGEDSWKQYTYTIFASAFDEEGKYNINISSVDRAKNESNNKVQEMTVEFVVDKTIPTMAISNLKNRGRYDTNTHQFIINVKDNTSLSKVEIYMENAAGELVLVDTLKGDDLTVEDGKLYIDIASKDGFQKVMIIAYDEAGNATEPAEYSVLVTENKLLLFYANKPLFFGTIFGVLAVIGFIFFIIWKRRKDEEEVNTAAK